MYSANPYSKEELLFAWISETNQKLTLNNLPMN